MYCNVICEENDNDIENAREEKLNLFFERGKDGSIYNESQ